MSEMMDRAFLAWLQGLEPDHGSKFAFAAGFHAASPSPLHAAALAALKRWRKADRAMEGKSGQAYFAAKAKMPPIEETLRAAADALLAAEGDT